MTEKTKLLAFSLLLAPAWAMAQDAATETLPALDKIASQIPAEGVWVTGGAFLVALILDLAVRIFKTEKPMTIFHVIQKGCLGLAKIFERLGNYLGKVGPQKIKDPNTLEK